MEVIKVLKKRRYKAGYEIRHELIGGDGKYGTEDYVLKCAYNHNGEYIGNPQIAYFLCVKYGIKPEVYKGKTCNIGYSRKDGKWYGWSRRAMYGFKIGDTVKEGDCCASSGWTDEYLAEHPEEDRRLHVGFTAKTMEDAKRMAIAFADSVS